MRSFLLVSLLLAGVAACMSEPDCKPVSCYVGVICLDGDTTFTLAWREPASGIQHECGSGDGRPSNVECVCAIGSVYKGSLWLPQGPATGPEAPQVPTAGAKTRWTSEGG